MAAGKGQGVVLGYLKYVLGFDSLAFSEGIGDAEKRMKSAQKSIGKTADKFTDIGGKLSLALTAPLTAFAATAVSGWQDHLASIAQVDAAIKSMGNAAGLSSQQLSDFADKLEMNSLADADDILRKSTANLLTFGNVAGATFMRAQQAAVDLSQRMGTDLQASTILVGKALNDPVKGLTALTRVGIQFTEQQKAQITAMTEAGNIAGAQAVILGELERQYGGAAQAAANTDPWHKVTVSLNQMKDAVGEQLLPLLPPLTEALVSILQAFNGLSPETQKWIIIIGGAAAALGPVLLAVGGLVSTFGTLLPLLIKIGPLWAALASTVTTFVLPALAAVTRALIGLAIAGGPLTLIIAAVTAAYLVWQNWDKIGPIVQRLYMAVKTWLLDKLNAVWTAVKEKIDAVGRWFYDLYDKVVGHSYIPDMVDAIGANMARLQQLMVDPAQKATQKAGEAFREMTSAVAAAIDEIFPKAAELRHEMEKLIAIQNDTSLTPGVRQLALERQIARVLNAQDAARSEISDPLGNISPVAGALDDAYSVVAKAAEDAGKRISAANDNAASSFADMANKSLNALSNFAQSIKNGGILDILSSAFNAFGALAGTGLFGGKLKAGFANFQPISGFRANGGPVTAGRTYVVGERGPETFTPSRSGYIVPNRGSAGIAVRVIKGDLFDVIVDQRAGAVAAPLAQQAAVAGGNMGSTGAQVAIAKRGARSIP